MLYFALFSLLVDLIVLFFFTFGHIVVCDILIFGWDS